MGNLFFFKKARNWNVVRIVCSGMALAQKDLPLI